MKWQRFILAAGVVCLLGFLIWALFPEAKESESPPLASSQTVEEEAVPIALISGSEPTDVPWASRSPAARRVRRIFPDPSWMTADPVLKAGDVITLALFDDAVFEAKLSNVTRYPNGSVGATAHLTGDKHGTVYLSYCDGQMRASVEVPGGADYAVRYLTQNQAHYAIEVDREKSIVLEGAESPVADAIFQQAAETNFDSLSEPVALADAPAGSTVVDVMIVYTPAALAYEGDVANMNDNIAEAMQRANEAHTNSNTEIYLRLVHSAEINYTESTNSGGYSDDLNYLTFDNDGEMDDVHDWRDQYGADFVCLFEMTEEVGGVGWLLQYQSGIPDRAFCLARVRQSSWTYTVAHEWGHNMGCHHSKNQVVALDPGPTFFSDWRQNKWSAGWQWDDTQSTATDGYCTIMTYEDSNNDRTNEYKQVAYFSNPSINYIGDSTHAVGDSVDGDNARTMRELKSVLAAYRDTMLPLDDIDSDGIPNDWEVLYFGGETNANPDAVASNGVNTILEAYIAGLNPTNPASFFWAALTNASGFVVQWNATNGRVYSVYGSTNLPNGFQPLKTNILWPQSSWTDTVDRSESFYQVDVQLAE